MTHNRDSQSSIEVKMQAFAEFETKIALSAPQPRENFQQELAQQLLKDFEQRKHTKHALTSIPSHKYKRLPTRTVAILVAILTIGIGAVIAMNTFLQQFLDHDAGFKAIYEQGLGHEIGISQTHEGYTVTLEWAYADGNRLILAYIIQGHLGTQYTNLESRVYKLRLRDTGEEIPFYQGMGTAIDQNGEPVGWGAPQYPIPTYDRILIINTYDMSNNPIGDRLTLDLHLEVDAYGITLQQQTLTPIEEFDTMKDGPEEHFTFDFSIPLVDEQRVLDTPLIASDQDITVILQRVNVSPSQTRVVVCFLPPDTTRQWTAIPRLTTNQGEIPDGGVQQFMDGNLTCNDYTYLAGMLDYTGEWQLEVTELVGFGSGGGNDQWRISGSWLFKFMVP